ncbi:protein translocase subunit SecD [Candidatus Peribacteria bacterium]|nr:MAG: protein translocase subunit SecD [Candidatus Peribacteria bacterium]
MASRSSSIWPIVYAAIAVIVIVIALPSSLKAGWAPSFLNPDFHFGLDLAGGTQLDFRISENEIEDQVKQLDTRINELQAQGGAGSTELLQLQNERAAIREQQTNLVEAIRTVLERRINALGVSEAVITPSYVGNEKHLLVECPGVVDVQQCIDTVGKTIQLEFKEEFTEADAAYETTVRNNVTAAVARMTKSGATLATLGQDLGSQLGMGYEASHVYFQDELPKGLEKVWSMTAANGVQRIEGSVSVQNTDAQGALVTDEVPGIFLVEVLAPRTMTGRVINEAPKAFGVLAKSEATTTQRLEQDISLDDKVPTRLISTIKEMKSGELKVATMDDGSAQLIFLRSYVPGAQQVDVSHILVAYKGANSAPANVTRTKEEALARAQQLKAQLTAGANFADIARTQSDGPSAQNAGNLGPITHGSLVPSFENVAFSQAVGVLSDPVETPFGYHIIRVDKAPYMPADKATFDALTITGADAVTRANAMLTRLQSGQVRSTEDAITLRTLFFSLRPTGWKDTELDGKHFRSATVTLEPNTSLPVVQIVFNAEGARLFQELTKANIGKRIAIFVGGELVSAPTVQTEITGGSAVITGSQNYEEARILAQDLNTGAIPAPIHLNGQQTVEATLGAQALSMSVFAGFIGMIIVMLYMLFMYRFLGVLANLALLIYAVIFIAILKLPLFLFSDSYIVLTLAGAAGMILSIGMAVDCNVLVFERVKEELKRGKMLKTAIEVGFDRAWPSIRDSNITTIITCVLLFMVGTSLVRGFAVTLGLGVIISMFTGMIITRWMARKVAVSPLANNRKLFPGAKTELQQ